MTAFPGGEAPLMGEGPKHEDAQLELYGHVEELCKEETELLEVEEHERTSDQHNRLQAIGDDLDRAWSRLQERAHHRGARTG